MLHDFASEAARIYVSRHAGAKAFFGQQLPELMRLMLQVRPHTHTQNTWKIDGRLLAFIWLLPDYAKSGPKKKIATETKREKVQAAAGGSHKTVMEDH